MATLDCFTDGLGLLREAWEGTARCWWRAYSSPACASGGSSVEATERLPSFRVDCDRDKGGRHGFSSRDACRAVAEALGSRLISSGLVRWPVDLSTSADCQVQVHLDATTADIGLLHQPSPNARTVAVPSAMSVRESISAA